MRDEAIFALVIYKLKKAAIMTYICLAFEIIAFALVTAGVIRYNEKH